MNDALTLAGVRREPALRGVQHCQKVAHFLIFRVCGDETALGLFCGAIWRVPKRQKPLRSPLIQTRGLVRSLRHLRCFSGALRRGQSSSSFYLRLHCASFSQHQSKDIAPRKPAEQPKMLSVQSSKTSIRPQADLQSTRDVPFCSALLHVTLSFGTRNTLLAVLTREDWGLMVASPAR